MKMSFINSLNLILILLLTSFKIILNDGCTEITLTGTDEEEQKKKCYSASTSTDKCCFGKGKGTGGANACTHGTGDVCPKDTDVPNNCGMAGIFQPDTSDVCKEISLVQGYCCYVALKKNSDNSVSSACIRTKKLNKNKNEATDQIAKYVTSDYTITSVECHGTNIKYYWLLVIAAIMLL